MFLRWVLKCSCRYGACKNLSYGENKAKQGRKNQDSAIFAQHIPYANLLLCQFSKMHALCPLPKSQCEFHRNANLVWTLCEFVFMTNFQNHALCLGEPQECEIHISSLKAIFCSSNSKLLLHFSQAKDSSHSFFIRNPLSPGRGASKFQISSWKAPISKPSHHEKSFSYLSQHFPPSKAKNFHHLNELQNFKWACE